MLKLYGCHKWKTPFPSASAPSSVYVDFVMSCGDYGAAAAAGTWNVWNPFGLLLRSMIQKAAAPPAAGWRSERERERRCLDRTTAVFRNTTAVRDMMVTGALLLEDERWRDRKSKLVF